MQPDTIHKTVVFRIGHNEDWLNSIRLGFTEGLWWLPSSLVNNLGAPFSDLVHSLIRFFKTLGHVVFAHFWLFGHGLMGHLSREEYDGAIDPDLLP